jgi:hypothetical protein
MKTRYLLPAALLAALTLGACGNDASDADSASGGDSTPAAAGASGPPGDTVPALPQPDTNRPLDSYAELKSGQQVMFLYVAASKLPPDFEKLAESFSREYRQTSDAFRRNDLLQALKPQLEQGINQAAAAPYAWVELEDAQLQSYDFERKGFTVGEFINDHHRYFHDASGYSYTWGNRAQVAFAPIADEAVARALESARTKWNTKPRLRIYFFAQSADLNAQRINAYVTHVQVTDSSGRVVAEYGPDGNVRVAAQEDSDCEGDAAACAAALFGF